MRKLERVPAGPTCLTRYDHASHVWGKDKTTGETVPTDAEKDEIWQYLLSMQQGLCAYCEAKFVRRYRRIDHFAPRAQAPMRVFDWDNLFGSCADKDTCDLHGARTVFEWTDLIKPDQDDPQVFLCFEADGRVHVRADLPPAAHNKAVETIRVFNLNHAGLIGRRKMAIDIFQPFSLSQPRRDRYEMPPEDMSDEELEQYLLDVGDDLPVIDEFPTAVKQVMGWC